MPVGWTYLPQLWEHCLDPGITGRDTRVGIKQDFQGPREVGTVSQHLEIQRDFQTRKQKRVQGTLQPRAGSSPSWTKAPLTSKCGKPRSESLILFCGSVYPPSRVRQPPGPSQLPPGLFFPGHPPPWFLLFLPKVGADLWQRGWAPSLLASLPLRPAGQFQPQAPPPNRSLLSQALPAHLRAHGLGAVVQQRGKEDLGLPVGGVLDSLQGAVHGCVACPIGD